MGRRCSVTYPQIRRRRYFIVPYIILIVNILYGDYGISSILTKEGIYFYTVNDASSAFGEGRRLPDREGKVKGKLPLCFNRAPRHEGVVGSEVVTPCFPDLGTTR
jgi:hypothetical protein